MRVVISCLNSKFVHASLSPWCLAAGVREFSKQAYDVSVIESTINGNTEKFAQKIINEKPDVVAFSCYIWNITKTLETAYQIKQSCDAKIVLGGPEVAYRPRDVLEKYKFISSTFIEMDDEIQTVYNFRPIPAFVAFLIFAKEIIIDQSEI